MSVSLKRIHHVAYRCHDAKETVEFYQRVLNMDFSASENEVSQRPDPYVPVSRCWNGNVLAFFELPLPNGEMIEAQFLAHRFESTH